MSVRFRWRTYLRGATTEQAVVEIVRTYLATWSAEEIAHLPGDVWPVAILDGRGLVRETLKIGQAHSQFGGTRAALALLQELLLFMTQASVRVTQVMPLPGETVDLPQRPVGGKVLSEEEKRLFEAPPLAKPVKDTE